jgi:hypothetical protein
MDEHFKLVFSRHGLENLKMFELHKNNFLNELK